jgi:hypothetical protein
MGSIDLRTLARKESWRGLWGCARRGFFSFHRRGEPPHHAEDAPLEGFVGVATEGAPRARRVMRSLTSRPEDEALGAELRS